MPEHGSDELAQRLAEESFRHSWDSSDEQRIDGAWAQGLCCECGEFVPYGTEVAHLATAFASVLNRPTSPDAPDAGETPGPYCRTCGGDQNICGHTQPYDDWDEGDDTTGCDHDWLDRPESDTHICLSCGDESSGPPPAVTPSAGGESNG